MDLETYEMLLQVACKEIAILQEELVKEKAYSRAVEEDLYKAEEDLYKANIAISNFLREEK